MVGHQWNITSLKIPFLKGWEEERWEAQETSSPLTRRGGRQGVSKGPESCRCFQMHPLSWSIVMSEHYLFIKARVRREKTKMVEFQMTEMHDRLPPLSTYSRCLKLDDWQVNHVLFWSVRSLIKSSFAWSWSATCSNLWITIKRWWFAPQPAQGKPSSLLMSQSRWRSFPIALH